VGPWYVRHSFGKRWMNGGDSFPRLLTFLFDSDTSLEPFKRSWTAASKTYKSYTELDTSSTAHFPDVNSVSSLCSVFNIDRDGPTPHKTEDALVFRVLRHAFQDNLHQLLEELKEVIDMVRENKNAYDKCVNALCAV
jgi:hypothetical protein